MKFLSDYITNKQTALFEEYGIFFAFGDEQLEKGSKPNTQYVGLGGGMVMPKNENKEVYKEVFEKLNNITKEGIKEDIKENGKKKIIWRELGNHEAGYTGSAAQTIEALEGYGFSEEEIRKEFRLFLDDEYSREEV